MSEQTSFDPQWTPTPAEYRQPNETRGEYVARMLAGARVELAEAHERDAARRGR